MTINALWIPAWYELDPSLVVGATDKFVFHPAVENEALTFFSAVHTADAMAATGTIKAIFHAVLGEIESVDTQGLDYTFVLKDGRRLLVNAEDEPGLIYEWLDDSWQRSDMRIRDWQLAVQFSSLSPLQSLAPPTSR